MEREVDEVEGEVYDEVDREVDEVEDEVDEVEGEVYDETDDSAKKMPTLINSTKRT